MLQNFIRFHFLFALLICFLNLQLSAVWASEEELLPPSVWQVYLKWQQTPEYSKAYGNSGQQIPLDELLIRDRDVRKRIGGKLTRKESRFDFRLRYGISHDWSISLQIPIISKMQSSSLFVEEVAGGEDLLELNQKSQKTVDNLKSDSTSGIGDSVIRVIYTLSSTNDGLFQGGFSLTLPTGETGTPRGVFSNSIGDRQTDLSGFVNYIFYPYIRGFRHGPYLELTNQFEGERETLEGIKGSYFGHTLINIRYHLNYEWSNWFAGGRFDYLGGGGSSIDGESQNDTFFITSIQAQLGYGNLSDLEKAFVSFPYQLRIGATTPLQGRNYPTMSHIQITGIFYF